VYLSLTCDKLNDGGLSVNIHTGVCVNGEDSLKKFLPPKKVTTKIPPWMLQV
jgi:hypothetical protein